MLVQLAPAKRKIRKNHKQPAEFMSPSREVMRVLMFGVPEVNIRPKGFIQDAFSHTVNVLQNEFQEIVIENVRETL